MNNLPLIELTPFIPPQLALLASVYMTILTFLEIRFLLQPFMFSMHHLISVLGFSLIITFASSFPLFSFNFVFYNVSLSL